MTWIKTIDYDDASPELRRQYRRIQGPTGQIDNVLQVHSLRPHTLAGHVVLYKSVLHHSNNQLPKWYLESIGIYVSHLNNCTYCVKHHLEGLKRLLGDTARFYKIKAFLLSERTDFDMDQRLLSGLSYAYKLTLEHEEISYADIEQLRQNGFSDGEILEINQVVSYFNYVNRTVMGLGVTTDGEKLGLSPSGADDESWTHI